MRHLWPSSSDNHHQHNSSFGGEDALYRGGGMKVARQAGTDGYFEMTGGSMYIKSLTVGEDVTAVGEVHLDGGTIYATVESTNVKLLINAISSVDITGGEFITDGDEETLFEDLVTADLLSGYGVADLNHVIIEVINIGSPINPEYETHVTAVPEPAMVSLLGLGGLVLLRRKRK